MRFSVAYVMLLLLLGSACSRTPGSRQKSALEPILGAVDVPRPGAILRGMGTLTIGGWAIAESGVERVAIYIDKQFVLYATLDGNRPDIAKAFPAFPNAGNAGWGAVLDLSHIPGGNHELIMQVKTKTGHLHDFPAVPFQVVP